MKTFLNIIITILVLVGLCYGITYLTHTKFIDYSFVIGMAATIMERVQSLLETAKRNPSKQTMYSSHLANLKILVTLILQYWEHLAKLEQNIDALAEKIEGYELIQSIPGIGPKIAATILAEIGEIDRFNHPKKLVAYARIGPSFISSGKFTATQNRNTMRGARQLRYALFMAVQ
ncbi:transposase [Bacillus sp. MM2020_4]|uniref:transposase n=1 Tax=Bacillaceae TaxID=186817 RepID=UPI00325B2A0D